MSGATGVRDRGNRAVVTVLGLLLALAGAYGVARSAGAWGSASAAAPLLDRGLRDALVDNAGWVGGTATFVAVLVAWFGWRWLRLQVAPSPSLRRLTLGDGQDGRTTIDAGAVSDAVARDLSASSHVAGARARVVEDGVLRLELTAEVAAGGDPQAVRTHVAEHVLPRARSALGRDDLAAHLLLRLADPTARTLE